MKPHHFSFFGDRSKRQEWDSQLKGLVLTGAINGYALFDRHTGQLLSCLASSGELIAEMGSGDEQPSLLAQELLHVFNTSEAKWQINAAQTC
jgi:hypothetical protein